MKANELRIGNHIRLTKEWYKINEKLYNTPEIVIVDSIDKDRMLEVDYYISWYKPDHLEGIPLNEEWLLKFGFEKKKLYGWKGNGQDYQPETSKTEYQDYVLNDHFFSRYQIWSYRKTNKDKWISEVSFDLFHGEWYEKSCENQVIFKECKYVHQLQNIYFALTGEELIVKNSQ